jgi:hypothetical protein
MYSAGQLGTLLCLIDDATWQPPPNQLALFAAFSNSLSQHHLCRPAFSMCSLSVAGGEPQMSA